MNVMLKGKKPRIDKVIKILRNEFSTRHCSSDVVYSEAYLAMQRGVVIDWDEVTVCIRSDANFLDFDIFDSKEFSKVSVKVTGSGWEYKKNKDSRGLYCRVINQIATENKSLNPSKKQAKKTADTNAMSLFGSVTDADDSDDSDELGEFETLELYEERMRG